MNVKSSLAQLAAAGINTTALVSGATLIVLVAIFCLRHAIFRTVKLVFTVTFALLFLGAIVGGAVWLDHHFGLVYAGVFIAAMALLIFLAGRTSRGPGRASAEQDDFVQDDIQRRAREHDLREAEHVRRSHEESIRRNPW